MPARPGSPARIPEFWLFALGGLFVLVTLFLPKGIVGTAFGLRGSREAARPATRSTAPAVPRSRGVAHDQPPITPILLYLDDVTVSLRRLQGAERALARRRRCRDARHHRPERRRQDDDDGRHHRQDPPRRGRRRSSRAPHDLTAPRRGRRSRSSASAASSRRRRSSSMLHRRGQPGPCAQGRPARRCATLLVAAARRTSASASTSFSSASGLKDHRRREAAELSPWPEAMARDRHAAGPGPEASPRRRAGRRHDRPGDRATPPISCARSPAAASVVVVEHDMAFVRDLDVKVTVLHEGSRAGRRLRSTRCSANERVIEVYLGR